MHGYFFLSDIFKFIGLHWVTNGFIYIFKRMKGVEKKQILYRKTTYGSFTTFYTLLEDFTGGSSTKTIFQPNLITM